MESNRDESFRCLRLAEKYLQQGDKSKAEKFGQKATKLFPSNEAKEFLERIGNCSAKSNLNSNHENDHNDQHSSKMNGDSCNFNSNDASSNSNSNENSNNSSQG